MKSSGISRKTKHQEAVLKLLSSVDRALTADEIRAGISEKINKTTVYRMLERFIEAGKVHFVTGQNGKAYYALCKACKNDHEHDPHNHLHFQCEKCGDVACLSRTLEVPGLEGYHVTETQFLLIGLCKKCNLRA